MAFVIQDSIFGGVDLAGVDTDPNAFSLVGTKGYGRASQPSQFVEGTDPLLGGGMFIYAKAAQAISMNQMCQFSFNIDATVGEMVISAAPWSGTAFSGQQLGTSMASPATGQWSWYQIGGFAVVNVANGAGQTISTLTRSGTTATCTTSTAHNLITGQQITVSGATPAGYNGTYLVTVTGTTTFTYTMAADPGASASPVGSYVVLPYPNSPVYYTSSGTVSAAWKSGTHVLGAQFSTAAGATLGTGNGKIQLTSGQAVIWSGFPVSQGSNT